VWIPESEGEILAAIEAGDLTETATFDAKATLPAKGKSKNLAQDAAAMANEGGTLLYGVGEDENGRPTVPQPFTLAGVVNVWTRSCRPVSLSLPTIGYPRCWVNKLGKQ
jgi:hypothetical protein